MSKQHRYAPRPATSSAVDEGIGPSTGTSVSNVVPDDVLAIADEGDHELGGPELPSRYLKLLGGRVPDEEEASYLLMALAAFRSALHRDPTDDEFLCAVARWDEGPHDGAIVDIDGWIDTLAVLDGSVPKGGTLPAARIDALRKLVETLPEALRAPWYLALQAAAEYDNQRDNTIPVEADDGGTCNITSVAMALRGMGYDVDAESLFGGLSSQTQEYLKGSGMKEAVEDATGGALTTWRFVDAKAREPKFWTGTMRPLMGRGYGVFLLASGHVVRVEAIGDDALTVDDPYGAESVVKGARQVDSYNHRDPNDQLPNDAGEGNQWTYAEWLQPGGVDPNGVRFIAPATLPEDVCGSFVPASYGRTVKGGLLDGFTLARE